MKIPKTFECFLMAFTLLVSWNVRADGNSVITTDGSKLSGGWRKSEDIISKSDAIFSGQFLTMEQGDFAAAGTTPYWCKINVLQVLKGKLDHQIEGNLRITNGGPIAENKPELNHTYIFFIAIGKENNRIEILKLAEATPDVISHVQQLIAQAPKQ